MAQALRNPLGLSAAGLAIVSAAVLATAQSIGAAAAAPAQTQVQTAEGTLAGAWLPGYRLFEGIPYAEPPVGKLRWRPPESPHGWTGVRPALEPGDECVQQAIFWRPGSPASWHEDCLYLKQTVRKLQDLNLAWRKEREGRNFGPFRPVGRLIAS